MGFDELLERDKALIERALDGFLPLSGEEYSTVSQAARYSLLSGGKRLRAALVLECCRIYGGNVSAAVPFACAVEMIHTYSLVHDDLPCMDDDDLRRGRPSCHRAFGEAAALLAGDGLLTRAFEIMAGAGDVPAERALRAIGYIAAKSGVFGMIGGQEIDLALEGAGEIEPETHLRMVSLKTAALIKASCACGGILAGCGQLDAVEDFAEGFGMAFQIIDDILDMTGSEDELGKPVGSDARQGKATFVSIYGEEICRQMSGEYLSRAASALAKMPKSQLLSGLCDRAAGRVR